jgi:hypothetical protein
MTEWTKGIVIAPQDKRLQYWLTRTWKTKTENTLDTEHKKEIMDKGLTSMWTTRKGADENSNEMNRHENWTRNCKRNRNDHMDETEIIILKKRRSNTEKTMTPGGETHFQMHVPTVSPREHQEGRDGWIEPEEMRRSLVDENIRDTILQ